MMSDFEEVSVLKIQRRTRIFGKTRRDLLEKFAFKVGVSEEEEGKKETN